MNKFVAFFLLASMAFPRVGFADPEAVTLEKGQHAPFSGTLLNPEAAAKVLAVGESDLALCLAESEKKISQAQAEFNLQLSTKSAELVACQFRLSEQQKIYTQQIEYLEKRATEPQWVKPTLFAGGVITGIAVVLVSAYALEKVQ